MLEHIDLLRDLDGSNGDVAFNAGAVSARYTLERRRWEEATWPPAATGSSSSWRTPKARAPN